VGGTGKTPTIEFLISLLQSNYKVAVLSRGYGRQSKGFVLADASSSAQTIGDEPFQIAQKFPKITVAVDANRQRGIETLLALDSPPEVVLLDDAFQHRKVTPGLSILLTTYNHLYCDDIVLPAGNLRELRSGAQRAQIVIVTKCPTNLGHLEKQTIKKRLALQSGQQLFFSSIDYDEHIYSATEKLPLQTIKNKKYTLVTGIANAAPLVQYLESLGHEFEHLEFADHHEFSKQELRQISSKPLVLTTEKDVVRLQSLQHKALYFLPIKTKIDEHDVFENDIKNFINQS
jgi:tetraacyldisaccharide 4'-kinase